MFLQHLLPVGASSDTTTVVYAALRRAKCFPTDHRQSWPKHRKCFGLS
jgi:hypothetical protein